MPQRGLWCQQVAYVLEALAKFHQRRLCFFEGAIGAVSHAAFGFYEQDEQRYVEMSSDDHREITGFTGNISLRDGKPFLHAHAGFATRDGSSVDGHVLPGCVVFVGEVTIREMSDVELEREPDEFTGLALWPL